MKINRIFSTEQGIDLQNIVKSMITQSVNNKISNYLSEFNAKENTIEGGLIIDSNNIVDYNFTNNHTTSSKKGDVIKC
ncbi:hypothetical protein [Clostridium butyricum]|uniref:hypothetical protein n=1 Tax=Clostridium butyricum TaxID=1492 RepID=UPI0009031573|nr:hypothetical protein [Clostridium butyricum]APF21774.1 hypothetical protein NPD4_3278 [Clostridium butyricum]